MKNIEKHPQNPENLPLPENENVETETPESWGEKAGQIYSELGGKINGALEKFFPQYAERNQQKKLQEHFDAIKKQGTLNAEYTINSGVVASVSKNSEKHGGALGVVSDGFIDCCGVVLQSPEGVGVLHISSQTLEGSAMEKHRSSNLKNTDYQKEIREAMNVLYSNEEELEKAYLAPQKKEMGFPFDVRTDFGNLQLRKRQQGERGVLNDEKKIQMQKDLRVTLFGGDKQLLENLEMMFQQKDAANSDAETLPHAQLNVFDFGTGNKNVLATGKEILLENRLMDQKKKIHDLSPADEIDEE